VDKHIKATFKVLS